MRILIMLGIIAFVASSCATTDGADTTTTHAPLGVSCDADHEECMARCRAVPDSGSRGPCFNECLRSRDICCTP